MNYNFLQNVSLIDTTRKRAPKELSPSEGLVLRIYNDGRVYPSKELIEKFDLEYKNKNSEDFGNGFDVVDSEKWPVTAKFPRMILIGPVSKNSPKVDIFGTCRFNEDGSPKSTVIDQGTKSTILLELVRSMGFMTDEQFYCDLTFRVEHPVKTMDGLAYIPKSITRGDNAGELSYERRENSIFYPVDTNEEENKSNDSSTTEIPKPKIESVPEDASENTESDSEDWGHDEEVADVNEGNVERVEPMTETVTNSSF